MFRSQSDQHATHDGHHRSAGARPHRDALQEADQQGLFPGQVFDVDEPVLGVITFSAGEDSILPSFHPDQHHAADREGTDHRPRPKEGGFDEFIEEHAEDCRRQEGDHQVREKTASTGVLTEQALDHRPDSDAVEPDHGEDRATLDDDVERVDRGFRVRIPVKPQQAGGDDEMAGGGDRQVLGDAFHQAEDDCVENRHAVVSPEELSIPSALRAPAACDSASSSASQGMSSRTLRPAVSME